MSYNINDILLKCWFSSNSNKPQTQNKQSIQSQFSYVMGSTLLFTRGNQTNKGFLVSHVLQYSIAFY